LKTLFFIIGPTIGWFACVIGAVEELFWLGPLTVTLLVLSSIGIRGSRFLSRILLLLTASIVFGLLFDSLLIGFGIYTPKRWLMPEPLATLWLLSLWANFSITIDTSLKWFQSHPGYAAVLGAIFGPTAYLAGQRLEALTIVRPTGIAIVLLAISWALAMVILVIIAKGLPSPEMLQKKTEHKNDTS
jgi:hypothetical protein